MNLELMAIEFLRFDKRCRVALRERSPRFGTGHPDVLGITQNRYLYEIEVKRSLSDFKANANKRHVIHRDQFIADWPKLFWYLAPHDLARKLMPLLPPWAGLLSGPTPDGQQTLISLVKATTNKQSTRLTTGECVRLAHCMANHIYSAEKKIHRLTRRIVEMRADRSSKPTFSLHQD